MSLDKMPPLKKKPLLKKNLGSVIPLKKPLFTDKEKELIKHIIENEKSF